MALNENNVRKPKKRWPDWYPGLARYERPSVARSTWQLVNTVLPYLALWYVMIRTIQLGYSYWLTLALAVPAAAFMVRIFIFFHDCGHGSFFASDRANVIVGYVTGILTFTPFHAWRHAHNVHHATAGNLDRRGVGDVWTMTVAEYQAASRRQRLAYRLIRNPLVLFGIGPSFMFLIARRFPTMGGKRSHNMSVYFTNAILLVLVVTAAFTIGLRTYLLVQLPIMVIGGAVGVWLFYVQHQFLGAYWARQAEWDPMKAAMQGSSYYRLPALLRWATGNIGLHHIHHLRPRIPNYYLQRCYDQVPAVQSVTPLTLWASFKCVWLNLWDEQQQQLVSFRSLEAAAQRGAA